MDSGTFHNGTLAESPRTPTSPDTLTSVTALARFEFEAGKGNDGTKILMVEWEDEDKSRAAARGSWTVSWSSKKTSVPADETSSDLSRKLYFLLPPDTAVPAHLTLTYHGPSTSDTPVKQKLTVYPLPAIFTPELGANAKASGKKGVLHTIWAKRRLQILEKEIQREREYNLEGIALEMALAERSWIESHFGITASQRLSLDLSTAPRSPTGSTSPSLQSPRSPGGRRLSDKLKGLSVATDEKGLRPRGINTPIREEHPLSPAESDMAYSSFKSFDRRRSLSPKAGNVRKVVSHAPPQAVKNAQEQATAGSIGLNISQSTADGDLPEDLFAKALSPRSPDDTKSPFSFSSEEVAPYAQLKGTR